MRWRMNLVAFIFVAMVNDSTPMCILLKELYIMIKKKKKKSKQRRLSLVWNMITTQNG